MIFPGITAGFSVSDPYPTAYTGDFLDMIPNQNVTWKKGRIG